MYKTERAANLAKIYVQNKKGDNSTQIYVQNHGGVRSVALLITLHEQTQYNRVCCFHVLGAFYACKGSLVSIYNLTTPKQSQFSSLWLFINRLFGGRILWRVL